MTFAHLALRTSVDCVELIDSNGVILWMNDTRQRLQGWCDSAALVGSPWLHLWPEPYRGAAHAALSSASTQDGGRFTAPSASDRSPATWWDVVVTPLTDHDGRVEGLLSIARDVTGFVTACGEREDLLEHERLARLDIEKENRKRDYALMVAAHELGAPLYAVRGWAQYLQLGNLDPDESAAAVEAIARNTDRQYHLVERLLEVARFRSKRTSFNLVANAIEDILVDAIECVRAVAGSKQITIHSDISASACVLSDFDQLHRAFSNILFNAIKFTPPEGAITVRCGADSDRIRVEFTDTGSGIDPEFLEKAFEPFSQEAAAQQPSMIGLGLGLSIVRRIVEGHQGDVRVSSQGRGLGSTFVIELPVFSRTTV